jgi:hypothetical protein
MNPFENFGIAPEAPRPDNLETDDKQAAPNETLDNPEKEAPEDDESVLTPETAAPVEKVDIDKLERTREQIKNKIIMNRKINLGNYKEIAEKTLEEIKKSPMLYFDGVEDEIYFYIDIKVSSLNEEARELAKGHPEKEKGILEMDLRNSEWMDKISKFIFKNRENPQVIESFWKRFDEIFRSTTFVDAKQGQVLKQGILTQMAAMDLVKGLEEEAKAATGKNISISIEYSKPEEDVFDKVDFWVVVSCGGREKKVPCQVKSLDMKYVDKRKTKYLENNIVNFSYPLTNKKLEFEHPNEYKLEEFFRKYPQQDAILVMLPSLGKQYVSNSGVARKDVTDEFTKKATRDEKFTRVFNI